MADETPNQQYIGLTPVARPTDQYARPEVRRKLGGGKLLQLADALRGTSPAMDTLFHQTLNAEQEGSAMAADKLSTERQFKNMQDLNGAVQRGEIPQWANPWFQVRLKQDTARNEATVAAKGVQNDLNNSDVVHQDNPDQVHNFISQRFGKLMQGRDAWEVAAMKPQLEQAHSQMMSTWLAQRGEDRIREAHEATGNLVMAKLDGFDQVGYAKGDPQAGKNLEAMTTDIQHQYDTLLHVTDKATASQWISDAVLNAARVHRNADVARTILDSLKGQDGLKFSSIASNRGALEVLPRQIQELKNADMEAEVRGKQLAGVQERLSLVDTAKKWTEQNPGKSIIDFSLTPQQFHDLSPAGYEEWSRQLAAMSQESLTNKNVKDQMKTDPVLGNLLAGTINGSIGADQRIPIMAALAVNGEPGRTGVEQFARFLNFMRDIKFGDTKPETLYSLNKQAESGTLTMKYVLDEMAEGHLDRHTAGDWMNTASRMEAVGARYNPALNKMAEELSSQIEAPYLKQGLLTGDHSKMDGDKQQAVAAFRTAVYNQLISSKGWDQLPFSEQYKQMSEMKDQIARSLGAPDTKTWLGQQSKEAEKTAPIAPLLKEPKPQEKESPTTKPSQFSPVNDPFTGDLDRNVLGTSRKMLELKTDKTLAEVMGAERYEQATRQFLQPAVVTLDHPPVPEPADQKLGLAGIHTLSDYRSNLKWLPSELAPYQKVQPTMGPDGKLVGGGKEAQLKAADSFVQNQEQQLWNKSMAQLQAQKPEAEDAKQKLLSLTNKFQQSGKLSFDEQQQARESLIKILSFQETRDQIGFTPEEVKEAGDGAWRSMPMFANPKDLRERGENVMDQLGVKDFQKSLFLEAQMTMLKKLREDPYNQRH